MTRLLLSVDEQSAAAASGYDEIFLWTGDSKGTFSGTLDPHLAQFGSVPDANVDFVRVALGVFAADRSVVRAGGGAEWNARELDLTIEVSDASAWHGIRDELASVIGFLTGDRWTFDFVASPSGITAPDPLPIDDPAPTQTVLLSGGADSAAGAPCATHPRPTTPAGTSRSSPTGATSRCPGRRPATSATGPSCGTHASPGRTHFNCSATPGSIRWRTSRSARPSTWCSATSRERSSPRAS